MAVAAEESSKAKAAKDVIKSLTAQVSMFMWSKFINHWVLGLLYFVLFSTSFLIIS